ncbi:shikimate dehydrogenase, partial [Methylobacterium aquaticum]
MQDLTRREITGQTRVFAILADPIAQVKTPQGLNRIMAERGVDGVMVPLHVAAADLAAV